MKYEIGRIKEAGPANEHSWSRILLSILLILVVAAVAFGGTFFIVSKLVADPKLPEEQQLSAEEQKQLDENIAKTQEQQRENEGQQKQQQQQATPPLTPQTEPDTPKTPAGPLSGKVIVIDPGHQAKGNNGQEPVGPGATETKPKVSSGTAGVVSRVPESQVVLDIGLLLRDSLEAQGATVYMVRTKQAVNIPNSERAALANEKHADLFLRLHCDGGSSSSQHGISMLVPAKNKWTAPIVKSSKAAGEVIQRAVIAVTGAKDNGVVPRSDLSGFNWCEVPSILVEMGFMTNKEEDKKLNTPAYQEKLAAGLTQGCIEWLK